MAFLSLLVPCVQATAQHYPDRVVRIINPYPPGGSVDVMARILAQKLTEALGQQVIVENRSGGGGNTGSDFVAKAEPDGYTLLFTAPGPLTVNQTLYSKLPFDPAKDFAPIALFATAPIVLIVNPGVPANNVQELIALARREPGKINFASAGNGTTNHLSGELFKSMAKIDIVHVPYRGAGPAMNDLIAGHVQMFFDLMPVVLPQIAAGKARALRKAGLSRVTVSLDSLDEDVFRAMNDMGVPLARVLEGIAAAQKAGFSPVKLNTVVKRGVNDHGLVQLARFARANGLIVRFIEYMDVGTTNG
jgi:tripartite-type tricarboxylate transporter receptor subunit TctC